MKNTLRAVLFAAFLLLPTVAWSQCSFPTGIQANAVVGRLGIGPGPCQAIPFSVLSSNLTTSLAGSLSHGFARMFPHIGQTNSPTDGYSAFDPYGTAISCTSTQTQCLQEFMNAAAASGWPAIVSCQGVQFPSGTEPIYIQANTSVTVPVAQDWSFHSYGCNLNFSVTTLPGLIVDSNGASEFDWDGKIVYNVASPNGDVTTNPSCAVYINPTTNTHDGFAGLYDGYFRVKSISVIPTGGVATANVCANTNTGGVHTVLEFQELQSVAGAFYGFMSFGTHGVTGSRVTIDHPHGMTSSGVKLNTAIAGGNIWTLNNVAPDGASAKGVWTFTSNDDYRIGVISNSDGSYAYGMYTDGTSANNVFRFDSITGDSTQNWFNNSSGTNYFIGQSGLVGYQAGVQAWLAQFIGLGSGAGIGSAYLASATQPSFAWQATGGGTDAKVWDCEVASLIFQCRIVNDANNAANAWLQVTRSGTTISSVQIGDGTHYATVPIAANDTLVGRATTDTLTNKTLTNPTINLNSGTTINWNADTYIGRAAAAKLMLGQADAAAPVAQTMSVQNVVAGTSNTAGAALNIAGSQGTGTGLGGTLNLQVAPPGTTGTAQNALVTGAALIPSATAPGGMTWAQGITGSGYVPWTSAVAEWRTGTNQRFSLGATNLLATGVSFNVFNDAISQNLGLEFRASPTAFTQGGVCLTNGATCTDPGAGNLLATASLKSSGPTSGVGYAAGAGGTVTQLTNRTTGVTLNNVTGAITLFNAAGSATAATFTVTNSAVAATDTITINEKSGTNLYETFVTAIGTGSFNVTFFTTGGTATDSPVFNFNVIKGSAT